MKVCIIGSKNLRHLTMTSVYTGILRKHSISYDFLYLDGYGIEEKVDADHVYKYTAVLKNKTSLGRRIEIRYRTDRYKAFVTRLLDKNHYDFLIIWGHEAAAMLSRCLVKKYRHKYCVNIRDLWEMEKTCFTRKVFAAIKDASFCTVSSDGFVRYLPDREYLFLHSALDIVTQNLHPAESAHEGAICITTIGTFRNDEYIKKLVDRLGMDKRFLLKFIGQGSERIEYYAAEKGYTNIVCRGAFPPEETAALLEDADIINCAYGAETLAEMTKLPIRLYYAVYMLLPILSTEGTWITECASRLENAIVLSKDLTEKDLAQRIFDAYKCLDWEKMKLLLMQYRQKAEESHMVLERELMKHIKQET